MEFCISCFRNLNKSIHILLVYTVHGKYLVGENFGELYR